MGENEEDKSSHPPFPQPQDRSIRVWRYLDLPKFIWLLDKRKLFLPRVDLLNDPHEGSVTQVNALRAELLCKKHGVPKHSERISQFRQDFRTAMYVSCWHKNKTESQAMWRLYCGPNQGVAIQTTYEKLANSITDPEMYIGLVKYIDYDKDFVPHDRFLLYAPFMHKRDAFAYESEVRIIKMLSDWLPGVEAERPRGITVDWNLEEVIEHIYINPYAPSWYSDVVNAVVRKLTPDLEPRVRWSVMKRIPLY